MLNTGLVSVSFRSLSCEEIITIAKAAKLRGIEWGGDVHVPPTDITHATHIGNLTRENGLTVTSYGSYFRLGINSENDFKQILDTAIALGTNTVRIWAGNKASADESPQSRKEKILYAKRLAKLAEEKNTVICFECHPDTLTDDAQSALQLIKEIGCQNVRMYWQPNQFKSFDYNRQALKNLLPFITHIHTFHWTKEKKLPLAYGKEEWTAYLDILKSDEKSHWCLLEFMPDDKPATLPQEAKTLQEFITGYH